MALRGIAEPIPHLELGSGKSGEINMAGELDRLCLRVEALHDHLAGPVSPARAPGNLDQELECPRCV